MSSTTGDVIPAGHVCPNLVHKHNSWFYLHVPLAIIDSLCLKPCMYLKFLGWCILGIEGMLSLKNGSGEIETDGTLDDEGVYYYVTPTSGRFYSKLSLLHMQSSQPSISPMKISPVQLILKS